MVRDFEQLQWASRSLLDSLHAALSLRQTRFPIAESQSSRSFKSRCNSKTTAGSSGWFLLWGTLNKENPGVLYPPSLCSKSLGSSFSVLCSSCVSWVSSHPAGDTGSCAFCWANNQHLFPASCLISLHHPQLNLQLALQLHTELPPLNVLLNTSKLISSVGIGKGRMSLQNIRIAIDLQVK